MEPLENLFYDDWTDEQKADIDNELFRRCEKPVSVEAVYEAAIIKRKVSPLANNHAELSAWIQIK